MRWAVSLPVALLLLGAGTAPEPAGRWGISYDDYPVEALRNRLQGTTRFEMTVDEAGRATACKVLKSSGHDVLDQQACAVLLRRAKFKPARNDAGGAVPGVWRHLVVWTPSNARVSPQSRPAAAGYGVNVPFDRNGEVSACLVAPLSAISQITPEQSDKCRSMGTATVFAELLGRPTQGLAKASFRAYNESRMAGAPPHSSEPVRRVLADVEIDRTEDGAITWCEVKVAPVTPRLGLEGTDLCGQQAYGVTRTTGGGHPEHVIYDAVATP